MANLIREILDGWRAAKSGGGDVRRKFLEFARLHIGSDDLMVMESLLLDHDFGLTIQERILFRELAAAIRLSPIADARAAETDRDE